MNEKPIPDIVVGRLPLYLRALQHMILEGRQLTSSQELAELLCISAAQIRKDLSHFGEFGKQGTGYNIDFLAEQLERILKVDRVWNMAVVGAGDIGSAVARYQGFANRGFKITLIFDNDPEKINQHIGPFTVNNMTQMGTLIQAENIKVAMITVPTAYAQAVADQLVSAGIKAILNYAPLNINVPPGVWVEYTDPVTHLQHMTYYLD